MKNKSTIKSYLLAFFAACIGIIFGATGQELSSPWQNKFDKNAEILNMRSQNMKHFKNQQGNFTAFAASGSIHYKSGEKWLEIDNTIVPNIGSKYQSKPFLNITNNFKTYYPVNPMIEPLVVDYMGNVFEEKITKIIFLDEQGKSISNLPIAEKLSGKSVGNQLTYKNIFAGVDLVYTQTNDGKKVDLVIHSSSFLQSIPANASRIAIVEEVKLPNNVEVKSVNSGIEITKNNELLVTYPAPFAVETFNSNKQYNTDNDLTNSGILSYSLHGNILQTNSSFDLNWLKAPGRSFPVRLDPSANYGPFAISMATGYMTTATGGKSNGFLRLAGTNTFAWAKFNIAGLASTGVTWVDSARYWGYHYTSTGADKISKLAGMANVDPVSALNTAIVSQINSGPNYNNNYVFGGAAFQWRTGLLDTALADTAILNSVASGWFAVGMVYLSGNTGFMYQYGWNATNATLVNYLEVTYQTAPCTNPVSAGSVAGNALVCGGSSTNLSLVGATAGTGVTYQWQSSFDSTTWSNVAGAQSPAFAPIVSNDSIYYRCEVICSAGTPAYTNAFLVKADIFVVTPTNAYEEGFESITVNNQLPSCMVATNIGTVTYTYIAAQGTYNRAARTGSKFGAFRYGCNDFFFTKGLKLTQGVTYSFSTWFVTDGFTGSWDSVALYVATAPNGASATLLPGTTLIQPSNSIYQKLTGSFTPTTTGVYRFAFKVRDAGIPWYLSIDDIKVEVAQAPIVATGTKSNITTSGVTLGGIISADGGAAISASGVVVSTSPSPIRGGAGVIDSASNVFAAPSVFTVNVAGLNLSTTYYYRAYAVNAIGTTYGADSTFTTNGSNTIPTVLKTAATNVQAYTATVGGNITSNGGSAVTASGIVYSTTPNPVLFGVGVVDSTTIPLVSTGAFIENIGGLSHSTKYYYRAYATNSVGTAYSVQDSFTTSPVISVFPYSQNFDVIGINTGWSSAIVNGTLNNWVLGAPAKTYLTGAFSGTQAWVTKLTGNYDDNHDAAVVSPQFDFSTLTAAPILRFKHKFVTETGWDALIVEMSVNGGVWTKVDNNVGTGTNFNTVLSTSWYNSTSTAGPIAPAKFSGSASNTIYSSQVNGWITSVTPLIGANGQANVKVRFRFGSDGSGNFEGVTLDDIEVIVPAPPTVATSTKTNITTSSVTLSGNITNNGGNSITASGIVVSTSPTPLRGGFGVIDSATNPLVGNGPFSVNLTSLAPATTYYYRAYAINGMGTSYGVDSTFTTNSSAVIPTVLRIPATNVQAFTATVGGNITSDGGSAVIASGIVYATTPNPALFGTGVVDSTTNPVVLSGNFTINPAGLNHTTKYYYRAYATNSIGTAYSIQDSFTTQPVISVLPYAENFDGATTPWSSAAVGAGTNNWVRGTPAKTNLSGAFSAPNAWVTGLTGNYLGTENCAVVSPQFDFSAQTAPPILRFKHKMDVDADLGYDGGIVEISINGGAWTKLDPFVGTGGNFNTANSTSWYNDNSTVAMAGAPHFSANTATSYSSQVNGWITSVTSLTGAAGQSNVRIRFRFVVDAFTDEGWAIDNIEVFVPSAPIVLTGTKTNITTSNATLAGNITNNGGNAVTASGVVVGVSPNPTRATAGVTDSTTNPVVGNGIFSLNLTGLTASTTYYYRAYAVNAIGTSYGADSTFTTPGSAVIATVLKVAATNVTTTTATFGGNITSDGGAAVTASGIVYATTANPSRGSFGVIDSTTNPLVALGAFSINPAGLVHSTKYYFRAYAVNSVGTAYSIQDSFVTDPIISTLPYTQNFESGRAGWNTMLTSINTNINWIIGLPTNNNWVLGTPAKTFLTGAKSGINAWVTKLTGQHDADHDASVVSPQFNFSTLTLDPIVRFNHKFKSELDWDGLIVEVSINGGYWRRADSAIGTGGNFNTAVSYGWYNNNVTSTGGANVAPYFSTDLGSGSAYTSQTNGWIESAFRLVGAAGQSNVRFRFRFIADGFVNDEGWAIDDIQVVDVITPTTAASNVTVTPSVTSANVTCTAGNGQGRMIVARLSSALAVAPTNNTLYAASAVFGSANITGTGNFIVYMGSGTSVNVTGLTALTGYTFDVYEYNGKYMHVRFANAISNSTTTTPVKLVSLKATKINEDILVNWTTASEVNNRGFNVERSVDGKTFEFIGFVKGSGNSSVTRNYTLQDANAFVSTGVNKLYYRLKQLDNDGKFEYSQVVTVENNNDLTTEIVTYPNPFSDKLSIEINGAKAGNASIQVMDISGRLIMSFDKTIVDGNQTLTLDGLAPLSQGVYFVRVSASGLNHVTKLIKQ